MPTSITYRCPGGLALTYSGRPRPYYRWVMGTWVGGLAIWRMWFREVAFLLGTGRIPYPTVVAQNVAGDAKRVFDRIRAEMAGSSEGCCHKTRLRNAPCPLGWKCPFIEEAAENV